MGYLHIDNLYKNNNIQYFQECYALEKIHGTSTHIAWKDEQLRFHSGGCNHEQFIAIFDQDNLKKVFSETFGIRSVIVYGEGYGGKMQGMSGTYGKELRFVAFDVKVDDCWLSVPQAERVVQNLGLEFVDYVKIPTDIDSINQQRDRESIQAVRNGCGHGKLREGIVLRPLLECTLNNRDRIISKHKRDEFRETKTPRVVDPEKVKVLEEAEAIASEWVTPMRLNHVLDKIENKTMENIPEIIKAMIEDVYREGKGEIVESGPTRKAIGKATVKLFKASLMSKLV